MKLAFLLSIASTWESVNCFVAVAGRSVSLVGQLHSAVPKEVVKQSSDQASEDPDMKAYAAGYSTVFEEVPCSVCKPSAGKLPTDLKGSYYRSGPAMFSAGSIVPPKTSIIQPRNPPVPDGQDPSRMVRHPYEGDGAILGVSFEGGDSNQATVRFRYIRTVALTNERKKGAKLYTGMESTRELGSDCALGLGNDWQLPLYRHHLQPGLNKLRKNTSNTRAIYWGKRLLSTWEGGQPYKMDALALSTEGRSRLGGAIRRDEDPFGSKMVVDSKQNRALFYGLEQDAKQSEITLYEFGEDFRLIDGTAGRTYFPLPGFAILNDFAATQNYAVFVQPPMEANAMQFLFKKEPGLSTVLQKGSSLLHLVPRTESSREPKTLTIPDTGSVDANLQFINAFEKGDSVVIDAIQSEAVQPGNALPEWPWVDSLQKFKMGSGPKSLWRYTANTQTGTVTKECLFDSASCAFGVINTDAVSAQEHQFIFMCVASSKDGPPQGVARFDCRTGSISQWMPAKHEFCGEPMFAPREGSFEEEDDGYILTVMLDGKRRESHLLVFDAKNISPGPISRVPLGTLFPHGLHGCFARDATWPSDTIERRSKLADKMESRGNMWNEVKSDFSGLGLRLDDIEEYFPGWFS
mmetsp:Transcript_15811/g.43609  ORF Transcript_15811/g.43609 Transcript_15811/m.43609 type:complete len:633 (-) Transcript_15811:72-1970(-)